MLRRARFACASTIMLALTAAGTSAASAATTATGVTATTVLSLTGYTSLAVDSVHGHVFVSGATADPVAVTDLAGAPVGTLSALTGADALALSSNSAILYAAISGTDEIAAVDTTTLQEVAVYFTGTGHDPAQLAVVGHDLWFSYGGPGQAGIGELNPNVPAITTTAEPVFYSAPVLAASPSAPNTLLAGNGGMSPSVIESFDVSTATPTEIAESDPWTQSDGCGNLHQLAISSSGTDVIAACGAPYYGQSLAISTLTEDARYQTGPYDGAVAVSRSKGTVALGVYASSSTVDLFTPGDATATASYPLGGFGVEGLAWTANGETLFAVTGGSASSTPSLNVISVS